MDPEEVDPNPDFIYGPTVTKIHSKQTSTSGHRKDSKKESDTKPNQDVPKEIENTNNLFLDETLSGFSLASRKKIETSAKVIQIANQFFNDDGIEIIDSKQSISTTGFSSTSGKKIAFSAKAIEQAQKLFQDDSVENGQDLKQSHPIAGFSSASGKKIKISAKAIEHAQKLFRDDGVEFCKDLKQSNPITGFSSASGKKIAISAKAIEQAEKLFQDDGVEIGQGLKQSNPIDGFSSASGKKITISAKAIEHAQKLFQDDCVEICQDLKQSNPIAGFSLASGKKIAISAKAIEHAQKLFQDDIEICQDMKQSNPIAGFSSASGKKIAISSKALVQAQKLFQDDGVEINQALKQSHPIAGFSSASGKKIAISSKAIEQAQKLFQDDSVEINQELEQSRPIAGFSSASGKKIAISSKAIEQAQKLFQGDSVEINQKSEQSRPIAGFSSASGKKIAISSKALEHAQKLFQDDGVEICQELKQSRPIAGFSSASGKKIAISSKALEHAQKLFQDDSVEINQELEHSHPITGFSSASGMKIEISAKAIQHAQKLFKDDNVVIDFEKVEGSLQVPGFSSASGKTIRVSPESLVKAKELFECDDTMKTKAETLTLSNFEETDRNQIQEKKDRKRKSIDVAMNPIIGKRLKMTEDFFIDDPVDKMSQYDSDSTSAQNVSPILTSIHNVSEDHFCAPKLSGPNVDVSPPKISVDEKSSDNFKVPYKGSKETESSKSKVRIPFLNFFSGRPKSSAPQPEKKFERSNPDKILAPRQIARELQQKKIEIKIGNPSGKNPPGHLIAKKKFARTQKLLLPFKDIGKPNPSFTDRDLHRHGVTPSVRMVLNSNDAKDFTFPGEEFFTPEFLDSGGAFPVGLDGVEVILSDKNSLGAPELLAAFRASLVHDPGRVLKSWFYNHYRWIVWKLAKLEQKFPEKFGGSALNPAELLHQMKLRFDREFELSERSALKKIYESDETSTKCMILVVANIWKIPADKRSTTRFVVELTDGWYSIGWKIGQNDDPFRKWIENGKIAEGTKLITFGAEVENLEKASSPLELPSVGEEIQRILIGETSQSEMSDENDDFRCVFLKLHPNSTRRARWFSKLGFQPNILSLPTPFKNVVANGGFVSEIVVEIIRKYPIVFAKFDQNGTTTFVSEKAEEKLSKVQNGIEQKNIEDIYNEVSTEFERKFGQAKKKTLTKIKMTEKKIRELTCGEDINEALESAVDPSLVEAALTNSQIEALREYKRRESENVQAEIKSEVERRLKQKFELISMSENSSKASKKSTPLVRIRILDIMGSKTVSESEDDLSETSNENLLSGMLTLWRPDKDLVECLAENSRFRVFGLSGKGIRDGEIQFRTTKETKFVKVEKVRTVAEETILPFRRNFTDIGDIIFSNTFQPKFGEVDLIGIVVSVTEKNPKVSSGQNFETVYICDTINNFAAVHFWGGLAACGYEKSMFVGSESSFKRTPKMCEERSNVLIFRNLQWRSSSSNGGFFRQNNREIPCLYVTELTVISGIPKGKREAEMLRETQLEIEKDFKSFGQKAKQQLLQLSSAKTTPKNLQISDRLHQAPLTAPRHLQTSTSRNEKFATDNLKQRNFANSEPKPTTNQFYTHDPKPFCDDDPVESKLVRGNVIVEDGSPAFVQSIRNKNKMEKLKQVKWHIPFSPPSNADRQRDDDSDPTEEEEIASTPVIQPRNKKLLTPFRIPFKQ